MPLDCCCCCCFAAAAAAAAHSVHSQLDFNPCTFQHSSIPMQAHASHPTKPFPRTCCCCSSCLIAAAAACSALYNPTTPMQAPISPANTAPIHLLLLLMQCTRHEAWFRGMHHLTTPNHPVSAPAAPAVPHERPLPQRLDLRGSTSGRAPAPATAQQWTAAAVAVFPPY